MNSPETVESAVVEAEDIVESIDDSRRKWTRRESEYRNE